MGNLLSRLSISAKVYFVVGLLAVTTAVTGAIGFIALSTYDKKIEEVLNNSKIVLHEEQVNGPIYRAVMDSPSVHLSENTEKAIPHARAIKASTQMMEEHLRKLEARLPQSETAAFQPLLKSAREFIAVCDELARLGAGGSPDLRPADRARHADG
jgi:methyl-accepting chemotaxis protein